MKLRGACLLGQKRLIAKCYRSSLGVDDVWLNLGCPNPGLTNHLGQHLTLISLLSSPLVPISERIDD